MSNLKPETRVVVVGGLTRRTDTWERAGSDLNLVVEHHDGNAIGARAQSLAAMVKRADVVVTITSLNSHNGVSIARKAAQAHQKVFILVNKLSPSSLSRVVREALAARTVVAV